MAFRNHVLAGSITVGLAMLSGSATAQQPNSLPVTMDKDGTIQVPAHAVPLSDFLSPEAKAYVAGHIKDMLDPSSLVQENGVPNFLRAYIARQQILYPTDRLDIQIGGVHVLDYTPRGGVPAKNRDRVLINLHGGGFQGCWSACAELESVPVASLAQTRVVTVDYREGPHYKFPSASEDVAAVYSALLKTYRAENIGIYGCSAGGMLTGMAIAWFDKHKLPMPGAIGIFCAGAAGPLSAAFGGDAAYVATPIGEGRVTIYNGPATTTEASRPKLPYLADTIPGDPLVTPVSDPKLLAKFPPTLIITATRGFEYSNAVYTHGQLIKAGVEADLHVWDGLFHGFFYNPDVPESRDAYDVMVRFFDKHLRR
jgi:acetyl esterase/lipase